MSLGHPAVIRYPVDSGLRSNGSAHQSGPAGEQAVAAPAGGIQAETDVPRNDLTSRAVMEISSVLTAELGRCRDEWRRTVDATLLALQRSCDTAITGCDPAGANEGPPMSAVTRAVERLAVAAAADAEAAAERARREDNIRITQAQAALAERESELQTERAQRQMLSEKWESELAACARAAEQMVLSCQSQLQELRSELETARAELALARQQLEASHAERSRLNAALETVRDALSFAESDGLASGPTGDRPSPSNPPPATSSGGATRISDAMAVEAIDASLELVSDARPPVAEPVPELVEYARSLLDRAVAAYWSDLESARSGVETVDRLTANLRTARDLFARRSETEGSADSPVFKRELIALLGTKSETAFGRHLAISAYDLYPVQGQAQARLP